MAAVAILRHEPPAPKPIDAPADEFSAGRAREVLRRLIAEGVPHPVGTEANARVRKRVIAELSRLGYEPSVQDGFACGRGNTCAPVKNVLARRIGADGGKAVMLCAHYDSVPAGPGASDDGVGVATLLEIARVVQSEKPRKNPIIFAIDDGEEPGLLGARVFAEEHPWAREIGTVVNIDGRGTSGASLLFETSDDNRWLIRLAAASLRRPNTSSLFYTIYKRLPNDTDLTVFRAHSMAGVNFAHIGGVAHYHTPLDNFAHVSEATLQHHGDNALAMTRALADTDLTIPHRGNAVFFDVFGAAIFWWPQKATPTLAVAALILIAGAILLARRRGELTAGALAWGLGGAALMLLLPIAACLATVRLEKATGALPTKWIAHPMPMLLSLAALALFGAWLLAAALARKATVFGLWAGVWTWWAAIALLLAITAPGLAFLFLVPALVAGVAGVPELARTGIAPTLAPAAVASFFWLPLAWFIYDVVGFAGTAVLAAAVALSAMSIAPTLVLLPRSTRKLLLGALLVIAVIGSLAVRLSSPSSPVRPERFSIAWREEADTGKARWVANPESNALPPKMARTFGFRRGPIAPWFGNAHAFAAPAAALPVLPPSLSILEDRSTGAARRIQARLRSTRDAYALFIALPPSAPVESLTLNSVRLPRPPLRELEERGGWWVARSVTPSEGISLEIAARSTAAFDLVIGDESLGLPAGADQLLRLRPTTATPYGWGDLSVVSRRIHL